MDNIDLEILALLVVATAFGAQIGATYSTTHNTLGAMSAAQLVPDDELSEDEKELQRYLTAERLAGKPFTPDWVFYGPSDAEARGLVSFDNDLFASDSAEDEDLHPLATHYKRDW